MGFQNPSVFWEKKPK